MTIFIAPRTLSAQIFCLVDRQLMAMHKLFDLAFPFPVIRFSQDLCKKNCCCDDDITIMAMIDEDVTYEKMMPATSMTTLRQPWAGQ